ASTLRAANCVSPWSYGCVACHPFVSLAAPYRVSTLMGYSVWKSLSWNGMCREKGNQNMNENYDYIIVGAGSAGCVMANRLSADPGAAVLRIESGPDATSPVVAMPRGIGRLLVPGEPHSWDYEASRGEGLADELWMKGKPIRGS